METIKHAAIHTLDKFIVFGKSHADCFHKCHHVKWETSQKAEHQGFITSTGRYVQRGEAYRIALAANQVEPQPEIELDPEIFDLGSPTVRVKLLFSEDLWSPRHGGKFSYDHIKGYVPHDT